MVAVVIGCFVATVFYLTHTGAFAEAAKATLNWVTVAGAALVGLVWPLMRRYWQAALLLVGLGVFRALFGTHPALSSLHTPLLTPFQSDFLWIPIGVTFLALVGMIVGRALISDRNMQAMRKAASTVTTGEDVADETAAAMEEASTSSVPEPAALEAEAEVKADVKADVPEAAPAEEPPAAPEEPPAEEKTSKKK